MTKSDRLFEAILRVEHLREMGENSSKITANNYVNIAERKRKSGENIWTSNSIENSVVDTIQAGQGTDHKFVLKYTAEERRAPTNWFDNLKRYIQQRMSDIAPNLQIFDVIKQAFIRHLRHK